MRFATTVIAAWTFSLATHVFAEPTPTQPAVSTHNAKGFQAPILVNRNASHPRNKNVRGIELLEWFQREQKHLASKYSSKPKSKHGKIEARQMAPIGDQGRDDLYYSQIGMGTPQLTYNVALDTGSSDFWIMDTSCTPADGCEATTPRYDASKSSSAQSSNISYEIRYPNTTIYGILGTENVTFAGYDVSGLSFARALKLYSNDMFPAPISGLMGLGFQTLNKNPITPFWQVISIQGQTKDPVFTVQIADNYNATHNRTDLTPGGVFTLGYLDHQQYTGDIAWMHIAPKYGSKGYGWWAVEMDSLSVNGNNIDLDGETVVAVDTGTTHIGGPANVVEAVYDQIPGSTPASKQYYNFEYSYLIPCEQQFQVDFAFGGRNFTLTNEQLNLGPADDDDKMCVSALYVFLGDGYTPRWLLGDTFLKTVLSVFSWKPERVGFASLSSKDGQVLPITSVPLAPSFSGNAAQVHLTDLPSITSDSANTKQTRVTAASGLSMASVEVHSPSIQPLSVYRPPTATSGAHRAYSIQFALYIVFLSVALTCVLC